MAEPSYTAYEESTGKALDGVEALCKHLTSSGSFSASTQPTSTEVADWLTEGWRQINGVVLGYGYEVPSAPASMDADLRGALQKFNIWWACAQAEYSQPSAGFSEGQGNRGDMFMEMFWGSLDGMPPQGIRRVVSSDAFQRLGATKTRELSSGLSAGGVSVSDKQTIETDTDMEQYAFRRGQFDNPGALSVRATRADL